MVGVIISVNEKHINQMKRSKEMKRNYAYAQIMGGTNL